MTKPERVRLLDTAMRSRSAEAYLAGVTKAFDEADRGGDASLATSLLILLRTGEIELLMCMRAQWLGRGIEARPRPDPSA